MRAFKQTLVLGLSAAVTLSLAGCPAPPGSPGSPGSPGDPGGSTTGQGSGGAGNNSGGDPISGGGGSTPGGSDPGDGAQPGGDPSATPNHAPTISISGAPGAPVAPGTQLTLHAVAQDSDGDALTLSWSTVGGPAVYFSDAHAVAVVVNAPLVLQNDQVTLRVTADDGRGGTASADANFSITVAAEFAGHPQSLLPYRENLTPEEAWHFVRRTEFGGTPQRVSETAGRTLSASIDQIIAGSPVPQWLLDVEAEYEFQYSKRWLVRLIEGPNPFHERMAMFWHDRFATSHRAAPAYNDLSMPLNHLSMLRRNALGNYRAFLMDLTLDPLMLKWLDGANSPASAPNENYAREFWELFTLGRDVLYTEQDIREAARGFTGITLFRENWSDEARPIFDLRNHDNTLKHVFPGRTSPANHDFESLIDLTLDQPEAARYVARNLFVFFVHDHPNDEVVEQLAAQLEAGGFEIAPVVRLILRSQAFFSSEARRNQILSPVEHAVMAARTLDMHFYREDALTSLMYYVDLELVASGHSLLDPPGVQGWDENEAWLADQWVISRAKVLLHMGFLDYGPDRIAGVPLHLLPPRPEWSQRNSAERIVDAMAAVLHVPLPEEDRDIYVDVLDQSGYLAFYLQSYETQQYQLREMIKLMLMDENVVVR